MSRAALYHRTFCADEKIFSFVMSSLVASSHIWPLSEVRGVGRGQVVKGLVGHIEEFRLYFNCIGKLFEGMI